MKTKTLFLAVSLGLLLTACGPNDFTSSVNTTRPEELSSATNGVQVNIRNNIPAVPAAKGLPTVVHVNGKVCSWIDLDREDKELNQNKNPNLEDPKKPQALDECHTFEGTIHSGDTESFIIPVAVVERLFKASEGGMVKFMFKSSAQNTYFFQGCSGSIKILPDFRSRKQVYDVVVQGQNTSWGYQCEITGK